MRQQTHTVSSHSSVLLKVVRLAGFHENTKKQLFKKEL